MSATKTHQTALKTDSLRGKAPGFIYTPTSDSRSQPNPEQFALDRHKSRLKRLKHSTITAARLLQETIETEKQRYQPWLVTLTYREGVQWNASHITKTIKNARDWFSRRGYPCRYVWVAEIQEKRKAKYGGHCVHYHIIFWLPRHLQLPKFDKREWWPHGMTETVKARNAVGYIAKYSSKGGKSTDFPRNCRMHGSGGLTAPSRWLKAWWLMPKYVREHFPEYTHRPVRSKGGGFVSKVTGDFLASIYEIVSFNPLIIQKKQVFS